MQSIDKSSEYDSPVGFSIDDLCGGCGDPDLVLVDYSVNSNVGLTEQVGTEDKSSSYSVDS